MTEWVGIIGYNCTNYSRFNRDYQLNHFAIQVVLLTNRKMAENILDLYDSYSYNDMAENAEIFWNTSIKIPELTFHTECH